MKKFIFAERNGIYIIDLQQSLTYIDQAYAFVRDTVAFLEYIGEPAQLQRRALGPPVIAFLVFFTLLAYALKKEYWKDVK